jgi:putative transposase
MPAKYVIRQFSPGDTYHVVNRGTDKRDIFLSEHDYQTFLKYLHIYVADPQIIQSVYPKLRHNLKKNSMYGEVDILAYCLMPNHFHLLVRQSTGSGVTRLMHRLVSAYASYYNNRYKHSGCVVQGKYKAVQVKHGSQLQITAQYILQNPIRAHIIGNCFAYPWSSIREFSSPETHRIILPPGSDNNPINFTSVLANLASSNAIEPARSKLSTSDELKVLLP